ncbi:integrase, catalytic region, zinc finger, CCHC-type containing protein [Tanacetum coccineum]
MSNSNTNLQTQSSNALHNAIMEAGSKDRPPMLAPGNYVQWKSRIKRYIDTKPNSELIHHCLQNPPYTYQWAEKTVLVAEGSSETTTERYMENYKNVSQDIRDQLNACKMWKAIERLKQGELINVQDLKTNLYWEFGKFTSWDGESLNSYYSRFYRMMNELVRNQCHVTNHQVNVQFLLQLQPERQRFVTLVKKSQELKTVSYHKLYDILKQHQNEVNEIRAKRLARTANPLALVAQQQPVYHHQNHPTQNTQYSSTRSQQSTRNRGKAIITSSAPTYDPEPDTVTKDDEISKDKEINKLMDLISLSFKKIYKPTNNNLQTSSNTSRAYQDNSPRINRGTRYDNQRAVNVARARENVGTPVVQMSRIQCYNCKEYGHVLRECQKMK